VDHKERECEEMGWIGSGQTLVAGFCGLLGLFNNAVSSCIYNISHDGLINEQYLGRHVERSGHCHLSAPFRHFYGMTRVHKTSSINVDIMAEILNRELQNRSQKWYPLDRDMSNSREF